MRKAWIAAEYARQRNARPPAARTTRRGVVLFLAWVGFALVWAAVLTRLPESWDATRAASLEQRLLTPPCREPERIVDQLVELGPVGLPAVVRALDSSEDRVAEAARRAIRRELYTEYDISSRPARLDAVARTMLAAYPRWHKATRLAAYPLLRMLLDSPRQAAMLSPSRLKQLKALAVEVENGAGVAEGGDAPSKSFAKQIADETSPSTHQTGDQARIELPNESARVRLESGSRFGLREGALPERDHVLAGSADLTPGMALGREGTKTRSVVSPAWNGESSAENVQPRADLPDGVTGVDPAVYADDSSSVVEPRSFGPSGRNAVRTAAGESDVLGHEGLLPTDRASAERGIPEDGGRSPRTQADPRLSSIPFTGGISRRREPPAEFAIPAEIRGLFLRMVSGPLDERRAAADALRVRVRSPGVIQAGGLVFDPSPQRRRDAVARLWTIPDIDPLPFLFELAVDPDPAVRRDALMALGSIANDAVRDWVISSCRGDESPEVRALAETFLPTSSAGVR
ncbi:HEAT repeat domain-containing protein [Thermopirellula anaerolimosa]